MENIDPTLIRIVTIEELNKELRPYIDLSPETTKFDDNNEYHLIYGPDSKTTIRVPFLIQNRPHKNHEQYIYQLITNTVEHPFALEFYLNKDQTSYITTNYGYDELTAIYSYLDNKLLPTYPQRPITTHASCLSSITSSTYSNLDAETKSSILNIKLALLWQHNGITPWTTPQNAVIPCLLKIPEYPFQ